MTDLYQLWLWQEARRHYNRETEQLRNNPTLRELKNAKKLILKVDTAIREQERRLQESAEKMACLESKNVTLRVRDKELTKRLYSADTRSHKELAGLQQQLLAMKTDLTKTEEEFLHISIEFDELKGQLAQVKSDHLQEKNRYRERVAEYQAWKTEAESKLEILNAECALLEAEVSPDLRQLFLDMTTRYGDTVLAKLENNLCSACHVRVPALLTKELQQGMDLIRCENCGRILYWEYRQVMR